MLIYQHSFLFQIFYRDYMALVTRVGVSKVRMRHVNNGMTTKLNGVFSKAILTQTVAQKRQTKTPPITSLTRPIQRIVR